MPQFDIFSFFSQLFWVFLTFTLLYLSLSYYLLPSISITLKVRKRKLLSQSAVFAPATGLSGGSYLQLINTNLEKLLQFPLLQPTGEIGLSLTQSPKISAYLVENEILNFFSTNLFQKVSSSTLLQKFTL